MAHVRAKKGENIESLIKRFKRAVDNEKILKEYKDRQYFVKPSQVRNEQKRRVKRKQMIENKLAKQTKEH
jgi:small subunit ribosomal protein S21